MANTTTTTTTTTIAATLIAIPAQMTVDWLLQNRKSKKTTAIVGYTAFTMYWTSTHNGTFAPKGEWALHDQHSWNVLADAYNDKLLSQGLIKVKPVMKSLPAPATAAVAIVVNGKRDDAAPINQNAPLPPPLPEKPVHQVQPNEKVEVVQSPIQLDAGNKSASAFNLWTAAWMKAHSSKTFPPKGTWKSVPEAEKKIYKEQLEQLKKLRATQKA